MFYRLITIDDRPLPTELVICDASRSVIRGGLLLEPPQPSRPGRGATEGRSILKFFGPLHSGTIGSLASSAEPFRWLTGDTLDISRPDSPLGSRFRGTLSGESMELVPDPEDDFLTNGSRLGFVAAPGDDITDDWRDTFNFGPPTFRPIDPTLRDNREIQAAIADAIAAGEAARRQAAVTRLEIAWRAPNVR